MKKIMISVLSIGVMLLLLTGCESTMRKVTSTIPTSQSQNKPINQKDIREIVWQQLPLKDKERINGTWKDGKTTKVILDEKMTSQLIDQSYVGKEVYLIDFPTKSITKPNNMNVIVDVNTLKLIGYGLVD